MSWAQKIHSERLGCVRVPCSWFVSELKECTRVPAQVHGWAFLSAPGPSGAFLCCQGLLSWKSWTILNPRQTVSHQKCCHNFYLERNQVLSQNCCLTKNRLIGEPKHPAQIRVWSFLQGSSSLELGFGFALPADGYSCEHSLCPPTRHSEEQEWTSQADPRPGHTDFGVLHRARYFGSRDEPLSIVAVNHFSCSEWCRVSANSTKTLRGSCCQLLILLLGSTKPHCSTPIYWK